ncbi:hypothetical protein [Nitratireductor thuwali]|uniref:Uncharacterized protein n=1 Tax=Nitratireductor thuwali TaxID=2267699 RepID=A0ABY5MNH7_9HYPH|nr:hypothetical protein NTH_04037 [Nitratireductor thuwali]
MSNLTPPNHVDDLHQIRDELQVVWCALTNPHHGEECVLPIAEHVSSLHHRLVHICSAIQREPRRTVGGKPNG